MKTIILSIAALLLFYTGAFAQTVEERIKILEEAIKKQEQTIKEQQRLIEELKADVKRVKPPEQQEVVQSQKAPPRPEQEAPKATALEKGKEAFLLKEGEPKKDILSYQAGGTTLRLVDISLDGLIAAGASTVRDEPLQILQGGGHDPRKRGFTVQNVELSLMGAVDPYFNAEAHLVYFLDPITGESNFELEEAFFTTQKLPYQLQLEGGHFFTEFGRINPQHPHQWNWQDQPIINTRLFGPDGMRAPGFRLGWLTPLPWFSELHFGVQNANGETMASFLANREFFEERPIGGRPFVDRDVRSLKDLVYLSRWNNSWDLNDEVTLVQGLSGLLGPNASGPEGRTLIYGADFKLKWRPVSHLRGWPFLLFESEIMKRDYRADSFFSPGVRLPRQTLKDWGFYTQLLWGFKKDWATGIRLDYVSGSGDSVNVDFPTGVVEIVPRNLDPLRNNRYRLSPLLAWHPTEFSRFRLQYNYDHFSKRVTEFEARNGHSVWLGVEFMLGAHAAHKY
jgi:uncharacterized coiled-coil protein SlyX